MSSMGCRCLGWALAVWLCCLSAAGSAWAQAGPSPSEGNDLHDQFTLAEVPDSLGRLDWGVDERGRPWGVSSLRAHLAATPGDDLSRQVKRVLQVAEQKLGTDIRPLAHLETEGRLVSDPAHQASVAATSQLDTVYAWAICARQADPPLSTWCASAASDAIVAWTTINQPSGNPISENPLIPLLQSIDLMLPLFTPDQQFQALEWTRSLGERGEALFAAMSPRDTRLVNNWNSWHLAIQGMVGTITNDADLNARTRVEVHWQISQNINADGSTLDFRQRDALHYHLYDLQALVDLVSFTDGLVSVEDEAAIERALDFIEPYFSGQQQHFEFVTSTVLFDQQRRDAGDPSFLNAPWKPEKARQLLRLARSSFPTIRPWTTSVVDENYSPRLKVLAALLMSSD